MFLLEKIGANVKIRIIGVTGNVSSGKSLLISTLLSLGVKSLSVDTIISNLYKSTEETSDIVKILSNSPLELREKIITLLGEDILTNGCLDKSKIADRVFSNKKSLISLEKITLPYVLKEISSFIKNTKGIIAIEVPLLYELSLEEFFDYIIFVKASKETCKKRSPHTHFNSRWDRFSSNKEKEDKANITITNSENIANFKNQITHLMKGIAL